MTAKRSHLRLLILCGLILCLLSLTACGRGAPDPTTAPTTTKPAPVPPAPKPTAALPDNASCITPACHATYLTAPHIHGPVSANSCSSCHQPDQGGHKYPLARAGNATCTFCHTVSGTKAHQHKVIEQQTAPPASSASLESPTTAANAPTGGCLACHDPHISKAKFLLTADNVDFLCTKCHNQPLKKFAHQPFASGQCTVCHQPHQSEYAKLLRNGDGPNHCYGCHTDKRNAMTQQPHIHKASKESCTTCHGPHSTDNPKLLTQSVNETCLSCHIKTRAELASAKLVHGAVTAGCSTCHDPHASAQPNELKARTDKVCMTCHDKPLTSSDGKSIPSMTAALNSKNLHGPVKAGNCSECHKPHAADQPNLLKKYFPDTFYAKFDVNNYALCFSCHDQQLVLKASTTNLTNFRDGDRNLHYVHVNQAGGGEKGRTCKTCHDSHGSNLPNHMAASVPFEGSNWSMPIRYEPNAEGGTCSPGCHDPKSYNRSKPQPATQPATRGAL